MKVIPCTLAAALAAAAGCARAPVASDTGTGGTGNEGGSGGGGAGGTASGMCMAQDPPAAAGGANFPFPQHRLSPSCAYPTNCADVDVSNAWTKWKAAFVVSGGGATLRVQRPDSTNDTVSEGIAYGMIAAVYVNDKTTFDGLWAFAQQHFNGNGVMNWHLNSGGAIVGANGATDADEDMAFALVMADKQWGGYTTPAKALINNVLTHEVESGSNVLKPGDMFGGSSQLNVSYLAPSHYRVFASYTGNAQWMAVLDKSYTILAACANPNTGLVPDWCNSSGQAQPPSGGGAITTYKYDACRTPWRIAIDACWNNEARAKTFLAKISTFFMGVGESNIKDGYNLDGTVTGQANVLAFVGPVGSGAMATNTPQLLKDSYTRVQAVTRSGTGSAYTYYNASWGVLSLLLMTGNLVNLTAP